MTPFNSIPHQIPPASGAHTNYPSGVNSLGKVKLRHYDIDIWDVEFVLLNGKIRKTWPVEEKIEITGKSLSGKNVGLVCRITKGMKGRVITVYEDKKKGNEFLG